MAMTQCRECGMDVADTAKTCPECGVEHPDRANYRAKRRWVFSMFALFGLIGTIYGIQMSINRGFSLLSVIFIVFSMLLFLFMVLGVIRPEFPDS